MDEPSGHPNILFIMTDQQRFDALSCHDGWIKTPNLDRLAASGVDLQGHFAQAPVCVPSRCSLFTGRYPHSHGVMENDARLPPEEQHIFKTLRESGYRLSYSGKNHMLPESEMDATFDHYEEFGFYDGPLETRRRYEKREYDSLKTLSVKGSFASGAYHDFPDEVTSTGRIANDVLRQLERAPGDQPWCVVASFSDPHVPHLAPRRFASWYPPQDLPVPEWDPKSYANKHYRMGIKRSVQKVGSATESDKRHYLAVYGSMCSFVDEQIGRILSSLQDRADAPRTMVVFVSDHGDFCWHQGLVKKDLLLYDDLLHVPALISWPGRIRPAVMDGTLSEHVDIVPTVLELAGITPPDGCDGRSMANLLRDPSAPHREEIHAEICYEWMRCGFDSEETFMKAWTNDQVHGGDLKGTASYNVPGDHNKCVRTNRWKYIQFGDGFEELYDLKSDPNESCNLAADTTFGEVLDDMRARLVAWRDATSSSSEDSIAAR